VYVGEPEPLEAEVVNLVNPLCYGDENGMVEIEITGGTPPYTADMGMVDGNMLTIDGLGDGAYTVEIDDSNGCGSIELTFVIEEPTLL
ncbi:SprB repeat-containing protein, partial [Pseudomonas sp. RTB2]|uniref:SprB repeat-containing protein n=1 Tax=Pseudomonas sp. RTB2 TaxID=3048632 RepID=UPI002B221B70